VIAVVGSINEDLVVEVPRFPRPGETIQGRNFARYAGGKGANQAVAAARLGSDVAFFGAVGDDESGRRLLNGLRAEGIDVRDLMTVEDVPTGVATIWVDERGENAIAAAPGANACIDPGFIDRVLDRLAASDVLLVQFEIPIDAVARLLERLPATRPIVIVNPAPARPLGGLPIRFERIDILTPNMAEMATLAEAANREQGACRLLERGIRNVVCTAGADGAFWYRRGEASVHAPAPDVEAMDTTAAGDAFNGAVASALESNAIGEAIRWGVAAGAIATTRRGAQPSLPTRNEVENLLRQIASSNAR